MEEFDEKTWRTLERVKDKKVLEISQKDYDDIDAEKLRRLKDKRRAAWEFRRQRDMNERERQDGIVTDWLKRDYARLARDIFKSFIKENAIEIQEFKRVELRRHDVYCWNVEIVGVKEDNTEIVLMKMQRVWMNVHKLMRI